ncbi:MAG: sigK [Cyanobacteria bacterium RYN_339]|nr:sigK [Cyanobacteria bacterium RYN_339]
MLSKVAGRDQSALATLYDRYHRVVFGLAFKIVGTAEEAEEVVLDVFNQAWRTAAKYDATRGRVDAWLFLMTRSRALDHLRARQRADRSAIASEEEAAIDIQVKVADPEAEALASERRDAVKGALGTLPEPQRKALELVYFEGLSHSEVADRTGEPLGTIKTRVRQGLINLREVLTPAWGMVTP